MLAARVATCVALVGLLSLDLSLLHMFLSPLSMFSTVCFMCGLTDRNASFVQYLDAYYRVALYPIGRLF